MKLGGDGGDETKWGADTVTEKLLVQGDQESNIGLLRDMPNFQSQYKCDLLAHSSQCFQNKAKAECDCDTHEKIWWHKVETLHGLHTSDHATLVMLP